ncbi:unnamed protein product [Aphanomyces euteiches]
MASKAAGPAASEVNLTLVPFCTEDASGDWVINEAIMQMLMDEEVALRQVALAVVLDLPSADATPPGDGIDKGLYIVKDPIHISEEGNLTFLLVLRNVNLAKKPAWATLALILASHAIFVREGHVYSSGFENLRFLSNLLDVEMLFEEDFDPESSAQVLKRHIPKLTYVVVDVDKKELGSDSFPAYFEKALSTPNGKFDYSTMMLIQNIFSSRDCFGIKTSMYKTAGAPHTAAKILSVAGETTTKPFFGRLLNCSVLAQLIYEIVPVLSAGQRQLNLRRAFFDVSQNVWTRLTESVYGTYADWMHAKILPYDPVKMDASYVVDLTEINLGIKKSDDEFHVIDHGQGDHSVFDEYGNLKKTKAIAPPPDASLDVGILQFLKKKKGLQRQPSMAVVRPAQDNEDVLVEPYFERIRAYQVPVKYIQNQPREKMPLDARQLAARHEDCVDLAQAQLEPFTSLSIRGQDEVFTGKWSFEGARGVLETSLASLRREFEAANVAASTAFCTKLVRYLHNVVIEKTHADDVSTSQSKLMVFLIAYRGNIEALVSQYRFLAKGPAADAVLAGFLQAVVPRQIHKAVFAAHKTFEGQQAKLVDAIASGKQTLVELNQSLADSNGVRADCLRREMENQRLVDERKADQARMIESSIMETQQQIDRALREKDALFAKTVETTQATAATVEIIAKKPKEFSGYLFRQEGAGLLGKKWKQSFFVLKDGRFLCFKAKSYFEEGRESMEPPINVSGYTVLESRNHGNEFKLAPPTAGRTFCFRAPTDEDKQTWVQKFNEASNY